jgi:hypothetical protein
MSFYKSPSNELDPLDNEILERAFDATWDAIKGTGHDFDAESDEELEAALRRELIEIAHLNGVSDPETLKDLLMASMPVARTAR